MWITADLPGVEGRLKDEPEDFRVWELPAYEPAGEGHHAYYQVTKRDWSTEALLRKVSALLGRDGRDFGYAGRKDRRAVTTQRISCPADWSGVAEAFGQVEGVLEVEFLGLHGNKLRRGHLRGNRFCLMVRDCHPEAPARAEAIAARLARTGWANYYGQQRFGRDGDNAQQGKQLVLGRGKARRNLRELLVNAYQSALFNRLLAERVERGQFATVLDGDVLAHLPQGGLFVSTDRQADQPRLERFEVSPAGPIFGFKMFAAAGECDRLEQELLAGEGIKPDDFRRVSAPGSRRRQRLPLEDFSYRFEGRDLALEFSLPAGSYATTLLDEFQKSCDSPWREE
ncbi:MAG: tRNA pseudouridine(13) synthase TruD [Candidatus Eremiobacteraeota bacterium]|nr:tRNA pseudouridine(13) synthase TruD [Candidatus Eremiobacteraeota bacterium]